MPTSRHRRDIEMRSRHGITLAAFEAMLAAQGAACAICKEPFHLDTAGTASGGRKPPCIDHDHDTGEIRGLLCRGCNTAEGWVKKHSARLAEYLSAPPARMMLDLA